MSRTASPPILPDTSVCGRCGAGLRCGMVAGDADCWCYQLPHLLAVPSSAGPSSSTDTDSNTSTAQGTASCLCPACLQKTINERTHADFPPAHD